MQEGSDVWATSIDDAVAEALENDNVALQNLSSSKYVQVQIWTCLLNSSVHSWCKCVVIPAILHMTST